MKRWPPAQPPDLLIAVLALVCGMSVAWPPLHLVVVDANIATYFIENIGWRFFWVQRFIAHVPGDYVHPGQGPLMPLIQAMYYLAGKLLGLDLYGQIQLFGQLTLAVSAIALVILCLLIAFDRRLDRGIRAVLVTAPLVLSLSGPPLFAYDVYPDYLAYIKVLAPLFVWRWLHHRAWEGTLASRDAAELGVLAGFLCALKIAYVPWTAGLLLIMLIAAAKTRRNKAWRIGRPAILGGFASMAGSYLIFYYGNPRSVAKFFVVLWRWGSSLTPSTSYLTDPNEAFMSLAAAFLAVVVGILLLLKVLPTRRNPTSLAVAAVVAVLAGMAAFTAVMRGGGSSSFDADVMVCLLCPVAAAMLEGRRKIQVASFAIAAVFFVWPAYWTATHWRTYETVAVSGHQPLTDLATAGDWQRELYEWDMSRSLPVYVLTPTNYETQGTIEDMIYMGFQNFGGAGADYAGTLKALYPQLHFLYFDRPDVPLRLPPQRVVFLHVTGDPPPDFPQLDPTTKAIHEKMIAGLLHNRTVEECYRVKQPMTQQTIVSCVLSAPK